MPYRCLSCGESDLQWGNTALICAAENDHAACLRLLIDAGADKEAADDVRCRSLLCWGEFALILIFQCISSVLFCILCIFLVYLPRSD